MPEKIIQLNEEVIKRQRKELGRECIEETLSKLLKAEAEWISASAFSLILSLPQLAELLQDHRRLGSCDLVLRIKSGAVADDILLHAPGHGLPGPAADAGGIPVTAQISSSAAV